MRTSLVTLAAAVALAGGGVPFAHANLVLNGDFSADTITNSNPTVSPPTDWTAMGDAGVDSTFPNGTDANDAFIGTGSLSQAMPTVPGTTYTVSFFVGVNDVTLFTDPAATFDATFGVTDLLGGGSPASGLALGTYTEFTEMATATGTSTTITFTGLTSPGDGTFYLADVDVEAPTSTIAEPRIGLALVGSALGLVSVMRRHRALKAYRT